MQLVINGHGIDLTAALRDHAEQKMLRLERYSDKITSAKVILSVDKSQQIAEATLSGLGTELFARAETDDMYRSIDELEAKLEKQLKKHKEKLSNHRERI